MAAKTNQSQAAREGGKSLFISMNIEIAELRAERDDFEQRLILRGQAHQQTEQELEASERSLLQAREAGNEVLSCTEDLMLLFSEEDKATFNFKYFGDAIDKLRAALASTSAPKSDLSK